jgi:hypothetical protein
MGVDGVKMVEEARRAAETSYCESGAEKSEFG